MPLFYKGAGPGTYWHINDARITGFTSAAPGQPSGWARLVQHIGNGSIISPYISLTKSYGIAWDYAVYCGRRSPRATAASPGYVYEIELNDPLPVGTTLYDAVKEVAAGCPVPTNAASYMHNGASRFILGVADPLRLGHLLQTAAKQPPPAGGITHPPVLSDALTAALRSLRDSEILVLGAIPVNCIRQRIPVH